MSQINSNTKDDFQVVFLLSCFVGHPVVLKILREAYSVLRFFSMKGLHFFFLFRGGGKTPPPKAYISLDNNIDVFKKFTNIFRHGVRFERTKLSSFKDKFLLD